MATVRGDESRNGEGAGALRECPHCHESILQSAAVCPNCRHYLRFEPAAQAADDDTFTALRIDGNIRHPDHGDPWEYAVVVSIRNDRGEEIAHKLIGVGALYANEQRTFTLTVEAAPAKLVPRKPGGRR